MTMMILFRCCCGLSSRWNGAERPLFFPWEKKKGKGRKMKDFQSFFYVIFFFVVVQSIV